MEQEQQPHIPTGEQDDPYLIEVAELEAGTTIHHVTGGQLSVMMDLSRLSMGALLQTRNTGDIPALIDTGAMPCALMGHNVREALFATEAFSSLDTSGRLPWIKTGAGDPVQCVGRQLVTFTIDGKEFTESFLIVPQFDGMVILGMGFLQKHGWTKPEAFGNYIVVGGARLDFFPNPYRRSSAANIRVISPEDQLIDGQSYAYCEAVLEEGHQLYPEEVGIFSIKQAFQRRHQLLSMNLERSTYEKDGQLRVKIPLINRNSKARRVQKGTVIGTFSVHAINEIIGVAEAEDKEERLKLALKDLQRTSDKVFFELHRFDLTDQERAQLYVAAVLSALPVLPGEGDQDQQQQAEVASESVGQAGQQQRGDAEEAVVEQDIEHTESTDVHRGDPSQLDYMDEQGNLPVFDFEAKLKEFPLDDQQRASMLERLQRHVRAFAVNPTSPNINKLGIKHHIDTGFQRPATVRLRRTSPAEDKILDEEVEKLLKWGIIQPSFSPWASPMVLAKKPDGSWRPCFDARAVNEKTVKDAYTMPKIDELLTVFRGAQYFTVIDAASGFWQVPLDETSIPKTAFLTKKGLYEFVKMPFGLCNAPATFQRLMNYVLGEHFVPPDKNITPTRKGLLYKCAVVYMDDICVYSKSWAEHLNHVDDVLERLEQAGISAKLAKCQFGLKEVTYLGYRVNEDGITADPKKLAAITAFPAPTNLKELRSALGTFGYYRKLIQHYSIIAEPLTRLTKTYDPDELSAQQQQPHDPHQKKKKPRPTGKRNRRVHLWEWGAEQQQAFEELKRRLTSAPILAHPDFDKPFALYTDACDIGVGGVLQQEQDGKQVVIGYYSQLLNKQQRKYSATEREALAIVKSVQFFRHFLTLQKFTVVTDHAALRYLMNLPDPTDRIARWIMYLQQFYMKIEHRRGVLHGNADGLSRAPVIPAQPDEHEPPAMIFSLQADNTTPAHVKQLKLGAMQRRDPVLNAYISFLEGTNISTIREAELLVDVDNYTLIDGVLYHLRYPIQQQRQDTRPPEQRERQILQLVLPKELRESILRQHHDEPISGQQQPRRWPISCSRRSFCNTGHPA
jgi:hypothetical protein